MDQKEFLASFEDLLELEVGSLSLDMPLVDLVQWDSLAFVSFLAMADSKYGVKVAPVELRACKTVGDLKRLVEKGS